tara:strand:+ start:4714 stop:5223 length:510 start_codon:yes stop_codon:yes gene_type:complete
MKYDNFKFSISTEYSKGFYWNVFTDNTVSAQDIVSVACKRSNKNLLYTNLNDNIGRIDLSESNIISIDFTIKEKKLGSNTSGYILNGDSIYNSVWGNFWKVDMSAVTLFGNRNLIQSFGITQPMLSRHSPSLSERTVKLRHKSLVINHLENSIECITSYLDHFLSRLEE